MYILNNSPSKPATEMSFRGRCLIANTHIALKLRSHRCSFGRASFHDIAIGPAGVTGWKSRILESNGAREEWKRVGTMEDKSDVRGTGDLDKNRKWLGPPENTSLISTRDQIGAAAPTVTTKIGVCRPVTQMTSSDLPKPPNH